MAVVVGIASIGVALEFKCIIETTLIRISYSDVQTVAFI